MQATACRMQLPLSCPRCCVDDDFATRFIASWCKILATVRMCSRATVVRAKLFRHWNTRQMQERVSVRRAIFSAKLRQNTRLSARLQRKFQQKIPIQQGFSEIFCCQQGFSKSFSKKNYSAGIQRNILLSARVQQIYSWRVNNWR